MEASKLKTSKGVATLKPVKCVLITMKENPAWKKQINKIKKEVSILNKMPVFIISTKK